MSAAEPSGPRPIPWRRLAGAVALSGLGVALLAHDIGEAAHAPDVLRWMGAGFVAVTATSVVVGNAVPTRRRNTNWALVATGFVLMALSLASAGLMATLSVALGVASIAGIVVTLALAMLTVNPNGRRYLPAASIASGVGLIACGAWVYGELGDFEDSAIRPGVLAVVSLVVPGVQTALGGLLPREGA